MDQKALELLYRSFDAPLTPEEQRQLREALEKSRELRQEQEEIATMRRAVSQNTVPGFEPFFAERVMRRIRAGAKTGRKTGEDFSSSLAWSFRRIAMAGAIAALLLLANNIYRGGGISVSAIFAMPQLTIEDAWALNNPLEGESK